MFPSTARQSAAHRGAQFARRSGPASRHLLPRKWSERTAISLQQRKGGGSPETYARQYRSSKYRHGEDKRRIHAARNHFIVTSSQQRIISAEMIADGHTVDDRPKRAAKVAHAVTAIAFLNNEMVARQPEWGSVIKQKIRLPWRQRLFCKRPPANNERPVAEPERGVELTLQPWILGSEIGMID